MVNNPKTSHQKVEKSTQNKVQNNPTKKQTFKEGLYPKDPNAQQIINKPSHKTCYVAAQLLQDDQRSFERGHSSKWPRKAGGVSGLADGFWSWIFCWGFWVWLFKTVLVLVLLGVLRAVCFGALLCFRPLPPQTPRTASDVSHRSSSSTYLPSHRICSRKKPPSSRKLSSLQSRSQGVGFGSDRVGVSWVFLCSFCIGLFLFASDLGDRAGFVVFDGFL